MKILLIGFWTIVAAGGTIASEVRLTEEAVLAAIERSNHARDTKDLAAKLAGFTDDFILTSRWPDGSIRSRMTLREYKAFLKERWARPIDAKYKHSHGKITVVIAPDGQTATARYESFQHDEDLQKGKIDWTNIEVDSFVLKEGKVLLKSVENTLQSKHESPP